MNLLEFNNDLPKLWLNPKFNSVKTNYISYVNQEPVPTPGININTLYFSDKGILSSINSLGQIVRYASSPPMANIVSIIFNIINGSQTNYNLLVGLSPKSTTFIPKKSLQVGDICHLKISGLGTTGILGGGFTIGLGTVEEGLMFVINLSTPITEPPAPPSSWTDAPFVIEADIIVSTPTLINNTGNGFVLEGDSEYTGSAGSTAGIPFNIGIDHNLTLTYTTSTMTTITISEILFSRNLTVN